MVRCSEIGIQVCFLNSVIFINCRSSFHLFMNSFIRFVLPK